MKITHQNVKAYPNKVKMPVDFLKISDPWYDSNVTCRYERDHLQMDDMQIVLKHDHIVDGDIEYELSELDILLANSKVCYGAIEKKVYEIGVDTAKYEFATEHGNVLINTGADGVWGNVEETYRDGKLEFVKIDLVVPDPDAMSEKRFIETIMSTMNLHDIHFKEYLDEDVDIDLSNELEDMEMGLMKGG
ncbi:hypothetical protein [[Clostridium] innocuum]|uniref:hypothetical protein n=1 Tax=Clostridium innocuum TaxID=1522 RepID=UPI000D6D6682|nr:hypothetical protein [[Clostridium] innocuum]PWJ19779.1 hypothetical protein ATF84_101323 [[Clostridium] innocuum]SSA37501.1 hypothetical protein SAMN04487929_101323 [[Clostridium] innocuum]